MTIFEHWQDQKDALRTALAQQSDAAGAVYQVRHAIAQAEQNALSEMDDVILRQQAGILMSSIKQSISLLEAQATAREWTARPASASQKEKTPLSAFALAMQLLICIWCAFGGLWFGLALALCALGLNIFNTLHQRRVCSGLSDCEDYRITVSFDSERLFTLIDAQMRSADRSLNDFSYLNDQLRSGANECSDDAVVSRASDLMEALYDVEGEEREAAEEAARRLLDSLGMMPLTYCAENSHYFTALPSKNATRTLRPAILSSKDCKLLQLGTAAVHSGAA